jgi:hypothetical protein
MRDEPELAAQRPTQTGTATGTRSRLSRLSSRRPSAPAAAEVTKTEIDRLREIMTMRAEDDDAENIRGQVLLDFLSHDLKALKVVLSIAYSLLVIPATSCAVERLFSRGQGVMTQKRRRLVERKVEALMVLQDNAAELDGLLGIPKFDREVVHHHQLALLIEDAKARLSEAANKEQEAVEKGEGEPGESKSPERGDSD